MQKPTIKYQSVDEYIDSFPSEAQNKLNEIRGIVRELFPQAEERISYQMPAFFLNGNIIYFAGYAKHIGFYPGANGVAAFYDEISKYKYAKGSVQFPLGEPLPVELIRRIINFKAEINLQKKKK